MSDRETLYSKIVMFFTHGIWHIRLDELSLSKSFLIRTLRILFLTVKGFDENSCFLRASALTFFTLISIVPLAAMFFGIAKGFGLEKILQERLMEQFTAHENVVIAVINFSDSLLKNTRGGILAGIGVIVLFWAALKVLGHIEQSFNAVWGIKNSRTLARKLSDYLSIMVLCPILIILSSSLNVFLTAQVAVIAEKIALVSLVSPILLSLLKLFPYFIIWILFTFVYMFAPNTKVNFVSALTAGIIGGTMYQFAQLAFIAFQIGTANYNAIYGSFAALPLFLTWMQLSWIIVLFGAELSFAHQNVHTYEFEAEAAGISDELKKIISLRVCQYIIKRFAEGEQPATAPIVSNDLEIPSRLVQTVLYDLVESSVLSKVYTNSDNEPAYQPARDLNQITVQFVMDALDRKGADNIHIVKTEELEHIFASVRKLKEAAAQSPANERLVDI